MMVAFWCVGNGICGDIGVADGPGMNSTNMCFPAFDLGQLRYEVLAAGSGEPILSDPVFLLPLVGRMRHQVMKTLLTLHGWTWTYHLRGIRVCCTIETDLRDIVP